ncbi:MAG: hypothetical protein HRT73_06840 [Flavobacteriales bacterium]|nr:hypothetical protein [Flavobacteriales bacterium]
MLVFFIEKTLGQSISNLYQKDLVMLNDTVFIDSLSLIPNSEIIFLGNQLLKSTDYEINYSRGVLILKNESLKGKTISLTYRVFPFSFEKTYEHKKIKTIEDQNNGTKNPFLFEYTAKSDDIFYLNGLNKSGSISRGVAFGNNQDLSVNSSLNLQLSGKISEEVSILASISDDNIPIQAAGNTQQLQEFDRVFIQLFSDSWKLTAGDFYIERPKSYFMNFNKKVKGGSFEMKLKTSKRNEFNTMSPIISAAVSKGKFARNKIQGLEGNQGPYRLTGAENETFIIILSGTESIYVDGKLLKRGNEFDYIIDYNTSELTFTTNKLITKDSRIVSEFQYSDKNYARSVMHFGNDYVTKKVRLSFNVYSEQDSRNQPLQQDLSDTEKLILSDIGDSLQNAIVPNVSLVEFSENRVLYKAIDTLGFNPVYVYSTNPDSAIYQLGFSFLGPNKGDYVQIQSSANGKVYEWLSPIAGVKQGEYEPIVLLVTPKTKQMATFGGQYNFNKESFVTWEGAVSNNDINTFSDKDRDDDIGYAFKINTQNKIKLNNDKVPWKFKVGTGYEYLEKNFSSIERFRSVEFTRDWNIANTIFTSNQHIFNAYTGVEKAEKADVKYNISVLKNEREYEGLRNSLFMMYRLKGFTFKGDGSFLTSKGIHNTDFLRHKGTLTKNIGWLVLGVGEETEQNKLFISQLSDSLQSGSFEFISWNTFIHNADTTINKFMLSYKQRTDNAPLINDFGAATFAEDITFSVGLLKNKNHQFRTKITYRKLQIVSTTLSALNPEENVLARVEYVAKFLKKTITSNTYYEVGSGLEVKKEFSFIEVPSGQGTHAYIGDLNGNGVKDLNEFEVAAFQDQAAFIKIFTPTNEFVRTFTNQFNQGLFLRPEARWGGEKGVKKMISRFSSRTNYRISRKVDDRLDYYNPFIGDIADTSLVTLNLGFLNTIYFNRTGTKFGTQFTFQDNRDRSLLTNGIESRQNINRAIKSRWNITREYTISLLTANGEKSSISEFFNNRNFKLETVEAEPKFTFQPNTKFRISVLYSYKEKINDSVFGGEELISQKAGMEMRYNVASKGSFRGAFNFIDNQFVSNGNASLDYEMLEGLQEGSNMTWEITYQQNLSKHMQLSINYNGRKSEESPIIHTAGVQVRAFF